VSQWRSAKNNGGWAYLGSSVDEAPRSSALGVRIEAPKGVGVVVPFPTVGWGLSPRKKNAFGSQNGEFW